MPDALLVVNASPLIFLGNAGHLELLHTLGASRIAEDTATPKTTIDTYEPVPADGTVVTRRIVVWGGPEGRAVSWVWFSAHSKH